MGMYSWTDYCNIVIREGKREAFMQYLEELKNDTRPNWSEYGKDCAKTISVLDDDVVEIQIESWKIISYWYDSTLDFFDRLSEYLEGELGLSFETHEEYARIHFQESGTAYELGAMRYEVYKSADLRHGD